MVVAANRSGAITEKATSSFEAELSTLTVVSVTVTKSKDKEDLIAFSTTDVKPGAATTTLATGVLISHSTAMERPGMT
jgi:hypothetical protein